MKPSDKYQRYCQQQNMHTDDAQINALYHLDGLYRHIVSGMEQSPVNWLIRKLRRPASKKIEGLYLWGGVGRGKTFLMDLFYDSLPIKQKRRVHFHQLTAELHQRLGGMSKKPDPIPIIASELRQQISLLCVDEFVVTEIGDAMLMGRLLAALFESGVILVVTSNAPPELLYQDGLQRGLFLPAIEAINQHCLVYHLQGENDYRTMGFLHAERYFLHQTGQTELRIRNFLDEIAEGDEEHEALAILNRKIEYRYRKADIIWFDFRALCATSRSRFDYIELARQFKIFVLTQVFAMHDDCADVCRRFISLIDVLYDHKVRLICSAEVSIENLYQGKILSFEFARTRSRLQEMQSQAYPKVES